MPVVNRFAELQDEIAGSGRFVLELDDVGEPGAAAAADPDPDGALGRAALERDARGRQLRGGIVQRAPVGQLEVDRMVARIALEVAEVVVAVVGAQIGAIRSTAYQLEPDFQVGQDVPHDPPATVPVTVTRAPSASLTLIVADDEKGKNLRTAWPMTPGEASAGPFSFWSSVTNRSTIDRAWILP